MDLWVRSGITSNRSARIEYGTVFLYTFSYKYSPFISDISDLLLIDESVRVSVHPTWDCSIHPRLTAESSSSCRGKNQLWPVGTSTLPNSIISCRRVDLIICTVCIFKCNGAQMSIFMYVRPSKKSFSHSDEIWYVGRGRWVMHDGMPHDLIQGQGHKTFKVRNSSVFKIYLLRHF